jgi:hypothetical protein
MGATGRTDPSWHRCTVSRDGGDPVRINTGSMHLQSARGGSPPRWKACSGGSNKHRFAVPIPPGNRRCVRDPGSGSSDARPAHAIGIPRSPFTSGVVLPGQQ